MPSARRCHSDYDDKPSYMFPAHVMILIGSYGRTVHAETENFILAIAVATYACMASCVLGSVVSKYF